MHRIIGTNTLNYQEIIENERKRFDFNVKQQESFVRSRLRKPHLWKGFQR